MLSESNFLHSCLLFEDRQAGVSAIYCPETSRFTYHAYCLETKIRKDLVSVEYECLEEALEYINEEFAHWKLKSWERKAKKGCGDCKAH